MMMPVSETLDMSWVQFSEEHGETCGTLRAECSNEAMWYGHYRYPDCPGSDIIPYCQHHKEEISEFTDKRFHCRCGSFFHSGDFIKWERINK